MTVRPASRAICAAATPTPPPTPLISSVCPCVKPSWTMPSQAVAAATPRVAASSKLSCGGFFAVESAVVTVYSENAP